MKIRNNILSKISLSLGLTAALAFASGCATKPGGAATKGMEKEKK